MRAYVADILEYSGKMKVRDVFPMNGHRIIGAYSLASGVPNPHHVEPKHSSETAGSFRVMLTSWESEGFTTRVG